MTTLFEKSAYNEIKSRVEKLTPDANRQWGKMNVSQMLAHLHMALETVNDKHRMPRVFLGRIFGTPLKNKVLGEKPFGKNSPTDKTYIMKGEYHFDTEKSKVLESLKTFHEGGPEKCTKHPHPFFGYYTPEQWARLQYKHMDHHLRQFGA